MNNVALVGRLTKDPDVRYGSASQTAIARFNLAINRPTSKEGEQSADFPSIVCFGKTAELVEKYVQKGRLVGITGHIQTGSYEKDGRKFYTTEVVADRIDFLDRGESQAAPKAPKDEEKGDIPSGFENISDDDIPF